MMPRAAPSNPVTNLPVEPVAGYDQGWDDCLEQIYVELSIAGYGACDLKKTILLEIGERIEKLRQV